MSSENDCTGSSGGSGFILESPLSSIIAGHRKNNNNNNNNNNSINSNKINNNNNEDTDCDLEKAVCASSNNNNSKVNNNNLNNISSATNGSSKNSNSSLNSHGNSNHAATTTATDTKILLKCDRCDSFETISHALLLVHVVQCRGDGGSNNASSGGTSSRQILLADGTSIGCDADAAQSMNDGAPVATASSSSSINHLTNDNSNSSLQLNSQGSKQNTEASSGSSGGQQQHQRKLFECDVCNMKFSNGANMRRHKMRHTGVKPYQCRVCEKRFFRKDHLAEHFTTHTKTLPYHCPICNRGFQRQIAMRAHFQNEHVGQNDQEKTCPMCNYRAGTMKSLRIHFFNRHGIDLDNPGPNAPSSLLMALDPTNAGNYLPSIALAAAAAAAVANSASNSNMSAGGSGGGGGNSNSGPAYSDSGDSLRSADNGTPPMHFLTPHVEISMADNDTFKTEPMPTSISSALEIQPCPSTMNNSRPLNGGSPSPHSADSNSNAPSSSQSLIGSALQNSRHLLLDGQITPSISLIPIKQEPTCDDYDILAKSLRQHNMDQQSASMQNINSITTNSVESSAPSSSNLTSLIKVSPLKSLLREDLKRRISARATNRATRNSSGGNNNNNSSNINSNNSSSNSFISNMTNNKSMSNNNTSTSSTLTSSPASASTSAFHHTNNNATSLTNTINAINHHHLLSNASITVTTESTTTSSLSPANSTLASIATTSNGAITSTGLETELLLAAVSSGQRNKRMLQCLFCGIEFPDQTLYFLHKGCHSESNPWKCNICGEQCNNVYEFNSHLLSKSHQ